MNGDIEKWMKSLDEKVENHLHDVALEFKEIRKLIAKIVGERADDRVKDATTRNDVAWLKRFFWIVATSSIGALVTGIIGLIVTVSSR